MAIPSISDLTVLKPLWWQQAPSTRKLVDADDELAQPNEHGGSA
jgi:hypothetical protein